MGRNEVAATITPLPADRQCEFDDCDHGEFVARVEPDGLDEQRILCAIHRAEYLQEVGT